MSKWINVKDRLPKPHTPVMVSDEQKRVCVREYLWGFCWTQGKMDVTHWMPLPKPPGEVRMSKWIDVKDRLPEGTGLFVVVVGGEVMPAWRMPFMGKMVWNTDLRYGINLYYNNKVTHWMPWPKSPEEWEG